MQACLDYIDVLFVNYDAECCRNVQLGELRRDLRIFADALKALNLNFCSEFMKQHLCPVALIGMQVPAQADAAHGRLAVFSEEAHVCA